MTTRERIEQVLKDNKIVLFMKGNPESPQCGFSARATAILSELKANYHCVDVLEDPEIRQGIKDFGQWPTIPQLYVNQKLIGGSDIMMEMFESGELERSLSEAV